MMNPVLRPLKNEKGILTLDFIFASVVVLSFCVILFSFAITLSVVEVVQYISFASARNFSLAHLDEQQQIQRGQLKYQELVANPAIRPFLTNQWFGIGQVELNNFNDEFANGGADGNETFVGARILFSAPILFKRFPMVGTTASGPEGFTANIQSFLAREPTFTECQNFITQRGQQFTSLGFNFAAGAYNIMMDNGC